MLNGTVPAAPTLDPKDTQLLKASPAAADAAAPVHSPVAPLCAHQVLMCSSPSSIVDDKQSLINYKKHECCVLFAVF